MSSHPKQRAEILSFTSQLQHKLKEYLQCSDPEAERVLKQELWRELPHPLFVTRCDFVPQEHALKKEAWIVSDAFEAITNGMFSPELSEELESLGEDSLFYPWKLLTQAVDAFYSSRFEQAAALTRRIPGEAAPKELAGFFSALAQKASPGEEWEALKASVLEDNRELQSSLDQLAEAAAAGMEDLLLETSSMIIRDILREHPGTAGKILVWSFHQLQEQDVLPDKAAERAQSLFGDAEGLRLTALAALSYDQDRSLVYWLLTLQAYLKESRTDRDRVKAYLDIIRDVSETVALEFELTEEYRTLLSTHCDSLIAGLSHLYPDLTDCLTPAERRGEGAAMEVLRKLAGQKEKSPLRTHKKTIQSSSAPVQLELFAL